MSDKNYIILKEKKKKVYLVADSGGIWHLDLQQLKKELLH